MSRFYNKSVANRISVSLSMTLFKISSKTLLITDLYQVNIMAPIANQLMVLTDSKWICR